MGANAAKTIEGAAPAQVGDVRVQEPSANRPLCDYGSCDRPAAKGRRDGGLNLCWGHVKQLQRKGRLSPLGAPPALTPLERVIVTGSRMLEAGDDDREWDRALVEFRVACRNWMASLGWRPPVEPTAGDASAPAPGDFDSGAARG